MNTTPEDRRIPTALSDGQVFEGRFQIISLIGRGGMGMVYKARQTHMNKFVAIKTLALSSAEDEDEAFLRFETESQAAGSFSHPNVVSIFDFGKTADGLAYLVMEYLDGKSLEEVVVESGPLAPELFLKVATQTCDGLYHAHKTGVIHRDIKPSNIMLVKSPDGGTIVKVVDFGMAKLTEVDAAQHLTKTGTIVGTPLFMSPEQCRGLVLDCRSDIYSLGCVLYTALTGKVPLIGSTMLDTLYKHSVELPPPFSVAAPQLNLPASLERVIFKSLQKDPELRQQTMLEFRDEIQAAVLARGKESSLASGPGSGSGGSSDRSGSVSSSVSDPGSGTAYTVLDGYSKTVEIAQGARSGLALPSEPSMQAFDPSKLSYENLQSTDKATIAGLRSAETAVAEKVVISKTAFISVIGAIVLLLVGGVGLFLNAKQAEDRADLDESKLQQLAAAEKEASVPPVNSALTAKEASVPPVNTALTAKEASVPLVNTAGTEKGTTPKASLVKPARELEIAGDSLWRDKHFAKAEHKYRLSLELLKQAFDADDARLFYPLARLVDCQSRQMETVQTRESLNWALQIFSLHGARVLESIKQRSDQATVWLPLARSSYDVAHETDDRTYVKWAVDFYALARNSWSAPTDTPEYKRLCLDYCTALDECGDIAKANQVRRELNIPLPQDIASASRARIKKRLQANHPHILHYGRMELWQR